MTKDTLESLLAEFAPEYMKEFRHADDGKYHNEVWEFAVNADKHKNALKAALFDDVMKCFYAMYLNYGQVVDDCGHDPSVGINCSEDFEIMRQAEILLEKAKRIQEVLK